MSKSIGDEEQYQQYGKSFYQKEQQYIAENTDYYLNHIGMQDSLLACFF